ncbi:MAG TPA: glycosyltransferase family 4 protein [Vicinamibacterales bacterium]|jgi:glycosyltransferase involved in cell wall biosynthesis|nr:glycosyltransferase family 4 protein [Vicinamibacterales bacterium]
MIRPLPWHPLCSDGGVPFPVTLMVPVPIAFVMTSFEPGGTERQMIELARRLDRGRWTVHVACFRSGGAWFDRVKEAARSVVEFPVATFKTPRAVGEMWSFGRWCRAQRIRVVHTTELYSNIFGLPGAAMGGVAVRIGNRREINPDKSAGQLAMQRAAYSFAHKVVANSHAAADRLIRERVPAHRVAIVPNGLDTAPVRPVSATAARRKVVVVANLRPEKGHDVLIDAAADILRRFPDARFDVVGGGPLLDPLIARARQRSVLNAFAFRGHCDDVRARLDAADIFVLPSRSEAFPNAVLEAMAAGLPIVASAVGGMCELIQDGETGLLVPPDNPSVLAAQICRLMESPDAGTALGAAARRHAVGRYSFERMVAAFEQIYVSELTRRSGVSVARPRLDPSVTR